MTDDTNTNTATVLYRYDCDTGNRDVLLLKEYQVVRRTPCGVWIQIAPGYPKPKLKFVLNDSRKRWAHETLDGAKESFLARKNRQLNILRNQIIDIEACVLALGEGRIADYSNTRYFDL